MEEHLSREEEIIVWNWKKESSKLIKLKLLKITIVDEQEPSVQSEDSRRNQSSAGLKLRK